MLNSAAAATAQSVGLLLVLTVVSSATLHAGTVQPESSIDETNGVQMTAAADSRTTNDKSSIVIDDFADGRTKNDGAAGGDVATTSSAETERTSHPDAALVKSLESINDRRRMNADETATDSSKSTADKEDDESEVEDGSQEQEQEGPEAREYDDDDDEEGNDESQNGRTDDEADMNSLDLNNIDLDQFDVIEKRILVDQKGNSLKSTSRQIASTKRGNAKQSPMKALRKSRRKRQGPLSLRQLRTKRRKVSPPPGAGSSKSSIRKPKIKRRNRKRRLSSPSRRGKTRRRRRRPVRTQRSDGGKTKRRNAAKRIDETRTTSARQRSTQGVRRRPGDNLSRYNKLYPVIVHSLQKEGDDSFGISVDQHRLTSNDGSVRHDDAYGNGVTAASAAAVSLAGVPVTEYELPVAGRSQLVAYDRPELRTETAEYLQSVYPVGEFDVTFDVETRRQPKAEFAEWSIPDSQGTGFHGMEQNPTLLQQGHREALPVMKFYPQLSDGNWVRLQQKSHANDDSQVGEQAELIELPQVSRGVGKLGEEDVETDPESEGLRIANRGQALVVQQQRTVGDDPTGSSTALKAEDKEEGHRIFGNEFAIDRRGKKRSTGRSVEILESPSRRYRNDESSRRLDDDDNVDDSEDEDVAEEADDREGVGDDSNDEQVD